MLLEQQNSYVKRQISNLYAVVENIEYRTSQIQIKENVYLILKQTLLI